MDYGDIIKRAWRVTWRYKVLWVLGFFAGGLGTSSSSPSTSNSSTSSTGGGSNPFSGYQSQESLAWIQHNAAIVIVLLALLAAFVIAVWILGVAARGGLIWLVNEAEEGRQVRLGAGWRQGFRAWWRVFGVEFLTGLPLLIMGLIVAGFIAASFISAASTGYATGFSEASFARLLVSGGCFLAIVLVMAVLVGIVLGIVSLLAQRYAVLEDRRVLESIKLGWQDVWSRRGAIVMFLITWGISIAFGLIVAVIAFFIAVPAVLLIVFGSPMLLIPLALIGVVLFVPLGAAAGTFGSAMWTIFFRKMTGMDRPPEVLPAYAAPVAPSPAYPNTPSTWDAPPSQPPAAAPSTWDAQPPQPPRPPSDAPTPSDAPPSAPGPEPWSAPAAPPQSDTLPPSWDAPPSPPVEPPRG